MTSRLRDQSAANNVTGSVR